MKNFTKETNYCSQLNKLFCYVVRDDQEPLLPVTRPTSGKVRDSQEPLLPVTLPSSAKIRGAQAVVLPVTLPNKEKVRWSQSVLLIVVGSGKYPITHVVT